MDYIPTIHGYQRTAILLYYCFIKFYKFENLANNLTTFLKYWNCLMVGNYSCALHNFLLCLLVNNFFFK